MTRMNPNHGGFIKAQMIGRIAKENDWHGNIEENATTRETILYAFRNGNDFESADEKLSLIWKGNALAEMPEYCLLYHWINLQSQHAVIDKIRDYPDVVKIVKKHGNRGDIAALVDRYRRLPFNVIADSNETIMSAVVGRHICWYHRMDGKVSDAWVTVPKKNSKIFEIRPIKERRLLNFVDKDIGMRSVHLDTLLKVE